MSPQRPFWQYGAEKLAGAWEEEPAHGSFSRLWHVFMGARVAIAGVLVSLQTALWFFGIPIDRQTLAVCTAYLLATLAVQRWARPRPPRSTFDAQWLYTIGVDVIAFSLLNFLQPSGFNYTPLFALPWPRACARGFFI